MSSPAPLEAMTAVQDDVRPEELHSSFRSELADACNDYQRSHHNNELKELINLRVPTHEFTQETTTSGLEYPPSQDRLPENSVQDISTKNSDDMRLSVHASETSDLYSLRSSTQPTISSAFSKSAPSSGADSSSKTVSTAPTSMISCSSGFNGIREVEKGVFAAPKMTMEPQDRLAWDKIQPKLQDTIFNIFRPRKDLDDTISCEFMMGGPSPTRLTPTVFLVCCHELYRKQLRSILKRQKWMRAYKYQCVVIVDTLEDLSFRNSDNTDGITQLLVEAIVPSGHTSWCGLKARAHSGVDQQPIGFTIGGILLIDGEAFALTVKHGIERLISVDAASGDDSDDDDDAKEESSSPFINFQDSGSIQTQEHKEIEQRTSVFGSQMKVPQSCTSLVDNAVPEKPYSRSQWRHFGQYNAYGTVGSAISFGRLDWSLLKVDPRCEISTSSLVNTLVTPTRDHIEIKSFLDRPAMTGGEVWINAGSSGPVKGWLVDRPALLHRYGRSFEVLQVIPDQPLGALISPKLKYHSQIANPFSSEAPGDSGSWVSRANVLCGHVLAARKSVPWLYVLPISEILEEAKAIMTCQDIHLPQHHSQIDVPAVAKKNLGFSDRGSTIETGSTATLTNSDFTSQRHEQRVFIRERHLEYYVAETMRACLGTLFRERVGCPRLDYTAFTNHCRSRLKDCKAATYWSDHNASCNEDVQDILQMIKTGLHRDELLDTLGQRTGPAPLSHPRLVQERIDRVASLLVMTEIGNIAQYGPRTQVSWRSGTLQQLINSHFTRERALSDASIRLEQIFTAKSLVQIAGLRIFWTANLSDHLLLDKEQGILHIFHHATYLECQRKRYEEGPFA